MREEGKSIASTLYWREEVAIWGGEGVFGGGAWAEGKGEVKLQTGLGSALTLSPLSASLCLAVLAAPGRSWAHGHNAKPGPARPELDSECG